MIGTIDSHYIIRRDNALSVLVEHNLKPKCLRSELYARNIDHDMDGDRMDPAHKAQDVGKRLRFYVQKLDAFTVRLTDRYFNW